MGKKNFELRILMTVGAILALALSACSPGDVGGISGGGTKGGAGVDGTITTQVPPTNQAGAETTASTAEATTDSASAASATAEATTDSASAASATAAVTAEATTATAGAGTSGTATPEAGTGVQNVASGQPVTLTGNAIAFNGISFQLSGTNLAEVKAQTGLLGDILTLSSATMSGLTNANLTGTVFSLSNAGMDGSTVVTTATVEASGATTGTTAATGVAGGTAVQTGRILVVPVRNMAASAANGGGNTGATDAMTGTAGMTNTTTAMTGTTASTGTTGTMENETVDLGSFLTTLSETLALDSPFAPSAVQESLILTRSLLAATNENRMPLFQANSAIINFGNGRGVRYVTAFGQQGQPVSMDSLYYVFEGLTGDNNHYVSAILPIRSTLFGTQVGDSATGAASASTPIPFPDDGEANSITDYFEQILSGLGGSAADAADEGFATSLKNYDALIGSVTVTNDQ